MRRGSPTRRVARTCRRVRAATTCIPIGGPRRGSLTRKVAPTRGRVCTTTASIPTRGPMRGAPTRRVAPTRGRVRAKTTCIPTRGPMNGSPTRRVAPTRGRVRATTTCIPTRGSRRGPPKRRACAQNIVFYDTKRPRHEKRMDFRVVLTHKTQGFRKSAQTFLIFLGHFLGRAAEHGKWRLAKSQHASMARSSSPHNNMCTKHCVLRYETASLFELRRRNRRAGQRESKRGQPQHSRTQQKY